MNIPNRFKHYTKKSTDLIIYILTNPSLFISSQIHVSGKFFLDRGGVFKFFSDSINEGLLLNLMLTGDILDEPFNTRLLP